ncbi:MAG: CAP domain-containing protein [Candidatus Levyibacteriota bacterium]
MQKQLLHRFAILALTLGTFLLSSASLAHAETFTPPTQYAYAGLTFTEPLTYEGPWLKTTENLSFTARSQLQIAKTDPKKPLEAIVITTLIPTIPTNDGSSILPTPVTTHTLKTALASTVTPTATSPTQAATYTPTTQPQATVTQNLGGLNPDTLFSMVNSYRQSNGLPAFQKDDKSCSLAASRAPEIAGEMAAGTMHSGLRARNLPYWNTENIISMNSEVAAFNWWINDSIHRQAIESTNTFSCVACSGNSCAEEFTSYQAK